MCRRAGAESALREPKEADESTMKISMFHLMPYRELPADFEKRYHSVWVDPPYHELADTEKVAKFYNWTLDELTYAAKAGMDGICVNEHHQNAYGFMPSPNLMGSALARATNGLNVALVQMGATLPTTIPPIRVAEEYGMLDCISGGRLVAGMPLGNSSPSRAPSLIPRLGWLRSPSRLWPRITLQTSSGLR